MLIYFGSMTMGSLAILAGGTGRLVGERGRWKEGIFTHFSFRGGVASKERKESI